MNQNEKRTGEPDTNYKNIQLRYNKGIWQVKKRAMIMKIGKRKTTEELEQPNQKSIRTFREKENYKYREISGREHYQVD